MAYNTAMANLNQCNRMLKFNSIAYIMYTNVYDMLLYQILYV
jgi:hypothetical protein